MKIYYIKAVWVNGNGGEYSGPYRQRIGTVLVVEEIETEEVLEKVSQTFEKWRNENPSVNGWRVKAWPELTQD